MSIDRKRRRISNQPSGKRFEKNDKPPQKKEVVPEQKIESLAPEVSNRMSSVREALSKAIDNCFRIAPTGVVFALNTLLVSALTSDVLRQEPSLLLMPAGGLAASIWLIRKQFILKARLENLIARRGYSDGPFEGTTKEWCDRQTARVVAQRHGSLERYEKLCDKRKDTMELPNLPHV